MGMTTLIRHPEYLNLLINSQSWNTPEFNLVLKSILMDGFIGALAGCWFAYRKKSNR